MEGGRERAGGRHTAEARGSGSNPNSGRHISSPPAPREDAFILFSVTWSEDNYLFFLFGGRRRHFQFFYVEKLLLCDP